MSVRLLPLLACILLSAPTVGAQVSPGDIVLSTTTGVYYTPKALTSLRQLTAIPSRAIVARDDSVYIAGSQNPSGLNDIVRVRANGAATTIVTLNNNFPKVQMDFDQTGDLIISASHLWRLDLGTNALATLDVGTTSPANQYVGVSRDIERGGFLATRQGVANPRPVGLVYVTRQGAAGGTISTLILSNITYMPDHNLVAAVGTNAVYFVNLIGNVVRTITISSPTAITYDQTTRRLYVTSPSRLHELDNQGNALRTQTFLFFAFTGVDIFADRNVILSGSGASPSTMNVTVSFRNSPNRQYCVGVALGLRPGIAFANGKYQNVRPGPLYFLTVCGGLPGVTTGFVGTLDAQGRAPATFQILPRLPSGLRLYVVGGVLNPNLAGGFDVSDTAVVEIP